MYRLYINSPSLIIFLIAGKLFPLFCVRLAIPMFVKIDYKNVFQDLKTP